MDRLLGCLSELVCHWAGKNPIEHINSQLALQVGPSVKHGEQAYSEKRMKHIISKQNLF